MVYFTCQNCNSTLKKKAVENHIYQCSKHLHLTCIDCLKDFYGQEYANHLACISENQKYGGKGYVPPASERKQAAWIDALHQVLNENNVDPSQRKILEFVCNFPTVPRLKKKFINMVCNQKPLREVKHLAESVFDLIQEKQISIDKEEEKKVDESSIVEKEHESSIVEEEGKSHEHKKKKQKKRKTISETFEDEQSHVNSSTLAEAENEKPNKKKPADYSESNVEELENIEPKDVANGEDESELKLSKKERKKLRKQKKYESELDSIENYKKENSEEESSQKEEVKKKKKKAKGEKQSVTEESNSNPKSDIRMSVSEPDDKKLRLDGNEKEVEVEKPKKFRWDQMIIKVLMTSSDREMPLKRLSRKVCGEYQLLYGDKESFDDILQTFNKKIRKIQRVVVFKDRAKLLR